MQPIAPPTKAYRNWYDVMPPLPGIQGDIMSPFAFERLLELTGWGEKTVADILKTDWKMVSRWSSTLEEPVPDITGLPSSKNRITRPASAWLLALLDLHTSTPVPDWRNDRRAATQYEGFQETRRIIHSTRAQFLKTIGASQDEGDNLLASSPPFLPPSLIQYMEALKAGYLANPPPARWEDQELMEVERWMRGRGQKPAFLKDD